ncbi:hypothetical protein IG9_05787 [Bacillus cereus HuA2-9]|nr:hypothetical protein IG9_05787 [Bacillus cereus HuA2-9]
MQGNPIRKNTARTIIHNDINNYAYLNIPMIINEIDGMIYEVLSIGFHNNATAAMITTDDFVI